jgi:hypothetical protein
MASIQEAFTNQEAAQGNFFNAQDTNYGEVEPNRFLPDNIKGNLGIKIHSDTLSQFNTFDPYTQTMNNRFSLSGVSQLVQGKSKTTKDEEYCRQYIGIQGLQKVIADQQGNEMSPVRCGWRYKKSPGGGMPLVSQGALGTRNGPLNVVEDILGNGVEWIWDLGKALDRHRRDFTARLPASAQGLEMAQASFPNAAWCSQTNRFIFVDQAGNPLQGFRCGRNSIVRSARNFPQAPQTSASRMAFKNTGSFTSCMRPGNNPSLSRDCLLQAIKNNGCSTEGTLYQAIEASRPSDSSFIQYLQGQPSFQTYQSMQGGNKITEDLFQKDTGTWELATREIQKLQRNTALAANPTLKVAAQDLCLTAGKFDEYDFCADIADSTSIAAVDLGCIQNYWQQQNGKPAGLLYPTRKPVNPALGNISTWGQYRTAVDQLKNKISSGDPREQRKAMNEFLGVSVSTQAFSPLNLDGGDDSERPFMFGPWIGTDFPVQRTGRLKDGSEVFMIFQNPYTKMVTRSGTAKYYVGFMDQFNPNNWDTYNDAFNNYLLKFGSSVVGQPLHLWLDAGDGGSITMDQNNRVRNWGDKSGRGNTLTQMTIANRPRYVKEAQAGIEFNEGIFLDIPNAYGMVSGTFTIFVVEKRKRDGYGWFMIGQGGGYGQNMHLGYRAPNVGSMAFWANDTDFSLPAFQGSSEPTRIWTFVKPAGQKQVFINGNQVAAGRGSSDRLYGWNGASLGKHYQGIVYEVLIFNTDLSLDRRQKIEGYLANKWGLSMNLPESHPYKITAP